MSETMTKDPKGILKKGWSATVDDYAITGEWACRGDIFVVGDAAGGVFGLNGKSGDRLWSKTDAHKDGFLCMAVSPNGSLIATGGQDGRCLILTPKAARICHVLEIGKSWVEHLAWSSDGNSLAIASGRRVYVYGNDGVAKWETEDHPSTVSAVVWSGSEELATACYGRVSFFDGKSSALRQKLEWKGSLVSMVLSPDGDIVACGSQDNSVHFWRRSSGQDSMMSGYRGKPSALAFDPAGMLLATSGGESATVWCFEGDGPEGTTPGVLDLHVESITSLTFANTGRKLASGARDGAVIVWSLQRDGSGSPVGAAVIDDIVASLAWRPDGRSLVALDAKGGVTSWRVSD